MSSDIILLILEVAVNLALIFRKTIMSTSSLLSSDHFVETRASCSLLSCSSNASQMSNSFLLVIYNMQHVFFVLLVTDRPVDEDCLPGDLNIMRQLSVCPFHFVLLLLHLGPHTQQRIRLSVHQAVDSALSLFRILVRRSCVSHCH